MATLTEDFEDIAYVISISGSWTRTFEQQHGGSWSMKSSSPATNSSITHTIEIPENAVSVRLWVYATSTGSYSVTIDVNGSSQFNYNTSSGGTWQQTPQISLAGATTLSLWVGAGFTGAPVAYLDDIVFTIAENEPEFAGWGIPI